MLSLEDRQRRLEFLTKMTEILGRSSRALQVAALTLLGLHARTGEGSAEEGEYRDGGLLVESWGERWKI